MGPNHRASSTYKARSRLAVLAICGAIPLARAYRGTVPIFPDPAAGKKKAADAAAQAKLNQRQKVFAPRAVIKATGLTKTFDTRHLFFADEHVNALDNITADIQGPGSVALVGETGSGKTTLLKCLAGLEQPTAGSITVTGLRKAVYVGRDITSTTGQTVRRLVRDQVASCLPGKSGRTLSAHRRDAIELTTNTILGAVDLHGCSRTKDRDLSGGEVYRFALAMALAKGCSSPTPPVLLLDGFFDRSDQRVRYGVDFVLFDLQRKIGVMLVFTACSHQVVMELAKQVVEMTEGRITEVSSHEKSSYARNEFERLRLELSRQSYSPDLSPTRYLTLP